MRRPQDAAVSARVNGKSRALDWVGAQPPQLRIAAEVYGAMQARSMETGPDGAPTWLFNSGPGLVVVAEAVERLAQGRRRLAQDRFQQPAGRARVVFDQPVPVVAR